MIKDVIQSIAAAAKKLFTNWGALLISFLLYTAFIAVIYLFLFILREATLMQVLLHLALLPVGLVILSTLQAMGVSYVRVGVGPIYLLKRAIKDCWRVLIISVPVILIGWAIYYFLDRLEPYTLKVVANDAEVAANTLALRSRVEIAFDVFRFVFFLFALPLLMVHLWISVIREGVKGALKSIGRSIVRAFSPRSVLIYLLTVLIFGAISYLLLFKRVSFKNEWVELCAVGIKTTMALAAIFIGWFLVVGSLAEMTARRAMRELES